MPYEIQHGLGQAGRKERVETATGCLERIGKLKGQSSSSFRVYDRDGKEITRAELEKRSAKEML